MPSLLSLNKSAKDISARTHSTNPRSCKATKQTKATNGIVECPRLIDRLRCHGFAFGALGAGLLLFCNRFHDRSGEGLLLCLTILSAELLLLTKCRACCRACCRAQLLTSRLSGLSTDLLCKILELLQPSLGSARVLPNEWGKLPRRTRRGSQQTLLQVQWLLHDLGKQSRRLKLIRLLLREQSCIGIDPCLS